MRGNRAKKRKVTKDARYNSEFVNRFIKKVMLHGKRSLAEKIVYSAIETGAKQLGVDPMEFLNTGVDNIRPSLELKARRVGGANYNVPVPVTPARQETLAIRWIVDTARKQTGTEFVTLLEKELVGAYNNEGAAVKKKEEVERMAEANKAFAHFKW